MPELIRPANNTGRLFDRKSEKTRDKQPDYTGQAVVDGALYRVALWRYPPSERCKVATCFMVLESESEYQQRIKNKHPEQSSKPAPSRKARKAGYSEQKYQRY